MNSYSRYFEWLLGQVHFERLLGLRNGGFSANLRYNKLLYFLFNKSFKYVLDRDENRMRDGLSLRYDYIDETGVEKDEFESEASANCTCLEVLVALAIRLDREYIGDPGEETPELIFWEMICNLNLDYYDDKRWDAASAERIIDIWLLREYDFDGTGGIFPLSVVTFDQRNVEIWGQAMAYISEK